MAWWRRSLFQDVGVESGVSISKVELCLCIRIVVVVFDCSLLQLQFSSPISLVFSAVEKGGGNNWKTKAEKFQPLKNYFDGGALAGAHSVRRGASPTTKAAREEN